MKRNSLTVVVGFLLLIVFLLLLFTFQVRQTEVAVVTTFDRPSRPVETPGLKLKLPWPIQKVYKFDKRSQSYEDKSEETQTRDGYNLLVQTYVGWNISNPQLFFNSFPSGEARDAEPALEGLVRSAKNAIVGQHAFSDFISTNEKDLKFVAIEKEILDMIKEAAGTKYGIQVQFLGIKKLGLPETVTQKVFDRMTAERQREVERLKAEGESEAMKIRSEADRKRNEILAKAEAAATAIRGQADAEAAQSFSAFNEQQELAVFLFKLSALEQTLKDRTTLILDERTSPFDLLANSSSLQSTNKPAGNNVKTPRP